MASQSTPSTLKKINGQYVKTCSHCGATLPIKYFSKHRMSCDGYSHMCKLCKKIAARNRASGIQEPEEPKVEASAASLFPETEIKEHQEVLGTLETQPVTLLVATQPQDEKAASTTETSTVNALSDLGFLTRLADNGFSITITIKKEGAKTI